MQNKQNVHEFNSDVLDHGGYLYANNAPYSSVVANKRMTDEAIKALRKLGNIKTAIDIGSGDGTYTAIFKERLPYLDIVGFDPAIDAVTLSSERYPQCNFYVGDIFNPETFPDQKFDVGILRGVIHHLPTQSLAIKNAALLTDKLLIVEPNGNNPVVKWIEKNSAYHIKHEEQSFSSDFLMKICTDNGFRITHISFIGFVPMFFPKPLAQVISFFQPVLEKVPLLGKYMAAQMVILAEK